MTFNILFQIILDGTWAWFFESISLSFLSCQNYFLPLGYTLKYKYKYMRLHEALTRAYYLTKKYATITLFHVRVVFEKKILLTIRSYKWIANPLYLCTKVRMILWFIFIQKHKTNQLVSNLKIHWIYFFLFSKLNKIKRDLF